MCFCCILDHCPCIWACSNTHTSSNISTLQIQNLLNLCLTKSKQGSPSVPKCCSAFIPTGGLWVSRSMWLLLSNSSLLSQSHSLYAGWLISLQPQQGADIQLTTWQSSSGSQYSSKALFTNTGCCAHKGGEAESPPARPVCSKSSEPFKHQLCRAQLGHTACSRMQVTLMATSASGGKGSSDWYRNRNVGTQIWVSAGKPREISRRGNLIQFHMKTHLKSVFIVM